MGYKGILKEYLDFEYAVTPFLVYNRKRQVTSWLSGVYTLGLLFLNILLCYPEIKEIFVQRNPSVFWQTEKIFNLPLISLSDLDINFQVKDSSNIDMTDDILSYLAFIFRLKKNENGETTYTDLKITKRKVGDETKFYLDENQNGFTLKDLTIGGDNKTELEISIGECPYIKNSFTACGVTQNSYDQIVKAFLKRFYIHFNYNISKLNIFEREFEHILTEQQIELYFERYNKMDVKLKYLEVNFTTPFDGFIPGSEETVLSSYFEDSTTSTLYTRTTGTNMAINTITLGGTNSRDVYYLSYNTIPSVVGSFYGMYEFIFFFGGIILDSILGYVENNYYFYLISDFFVNAAKKDNPPPRIKKKKIFKTGVATNSEEMIQKDKDDASVSQEVLNERANEVSKEKYIIDRRNRFTDGLLKHCCLSGKLKENNKYFEEGKNIIMKYLDVVFLMKKLFEFEEFCSYSVENRAWDPHLINYKLLKDCNEENIYYNEWFNYQNKTLYTQKKSDQEIEMQGL